jgi:hypothetical protein
MRAAAQTSGMNALILDIALPRALVSNARVDSTSLKELS